MYLHSALVYNKEFLRQKSGSFKGYPFRTYAGVFIWEVTATTSLSMPFWQT
jgi:hypothetical protein